MSLLTIFEAPHQLHPRAADGGLVGFAPIDAIDLRKCLVLMWRGKITILVTMLVALLLAGLFVLVVPHRYTAVVQILIDPTDLRAVDTDLMPANESSSEAALLQVESQVHVLTSDSVLRRVVKSESLDQDPEFFDPSASSGEAGRVTSALTMLRRSMKVSRAEQTYVVEVSVTARERAKAARIANAIAQAYLEEQTAIRSEAARQISLSLSARLNELKDRVRQAEDKVEAYKARNNIVGASGQLVNEQQLAEMNSELSVARARTAAAKARLDQIQQLQGSPDQIGAFPEAVQSQTISALRSQYAEVMRREAEQMSSLGARHPAATEIQAEAERLRRMIDDEVRRIAGSARTDYESARANEEMLARELEKLKSNTVNTNEALVTLRELERDVQANRAVYEAFLVRARQTGEQGRLDTKNIRVISWANIPISRSFPPGNMLIAIGALLLGAAAGTRIVISRDVYRVGSIFTPDASGFGKKAARLFDVIWPTGAVPSTIPVLAVLPGVDVAFGIAAAQNPQSRFAAEVRKIYEDICDSSTSRHQSILVVASDDHDETVMVALVLAAALADMQRVLLIDADIKCRTLSAIDADRTEAGLADVALGRRTLSDVIVRDQRANMHLASFVSPSSHHDRRLSEADIEQAFEQTRRFDTVIVAAVDFDDQPSTAFFSGLVDHIVLVARADADNDPAIENFVSRVGLAARKIRGAVLTDDRGA